MAAKIRLARVGSKKNPIYRVVVADSRSPRDGRFIEIVGRYNPQTDPSTIELDEAKIEDWVSKGAEMSDPVKRLLKAKSAYVGGLVADTMVDFVAHVARQLVDHPDEVRVERMERDGAIVLRLHVASDDIGKVIGRQGRVIRALRTIVRASGTKPGERRLLEIAE